MASFIDKVKIKTGIDSRSEQNLDHIHITTGSWFQLNPAYGTKVYDKETYELEMDTFVRGLPMARPTFGRATIHNRAFFVPHRSIFPAYNEWRVDTIRVPYRNSTGASSPGFVYPDKSPFFTVANLFRCFYGNVASGNTDFATISTSTIYDMKINRSGTTEYYLLTTLGRQALKVLNSLGFQLINTNDATLGAEEISAIPLLALARVYLDWYYPSAYAESVSYCLVEQTLRIDVASPSIDYSQLAGILKYCTYSNYDSDYFVSCWDNPVAPNAGLYSPISIPDVTNNSSSSTWKGSVELATTPSTAYPSGTPYLKNNVQVSALNSASNINTKFTQFIDTALHKLTDFVRRNQLSGARVLDRYLARFGVQMTPDKLGRSLFITYNEVPYFVGDVMSQADTISPTGGSALGDYAGKGVAYDPEGKNLNFKFTAQEDGFLLVLSSIIPEVGYYQGIDRNNLDVTKLQWWNPEFDALGTQVTLPAELYIPEEGDSALLTDALFTGSFGFHPRYAHQKREMDRLSGDYRVRTLNNNGAEDAWYLFRDIDNLASGWTAVTDIKHSFDFVRGLPDSLQYNRIFLYSTATQDLFRIFYRFRIKALTRKKPLYESYEFEGNGLEVTEQVGGVKMN